MRMSGVSLNLKMRIRRSIFIEEAASVMPLYQQIFVEQKAGFVSMREKWHWIWRIN